MKDKEKQLNVSTKQEIEARNKIGKEKDELSQALLHYATAEASGGIKSLIDCEGCAFYLYEMLGYRKVKDSVVISMKEYELLKSLDESYNHLEKTKDELLSERNRLTLQLIQSSKETAEKIYKEVEFISLRNSNSALLKELRNFIAKQFGVEIKE